MKKFFRVIDTYLRDMTCDYDAGVTSAALLLVAVVSALIIGTTLAITNSKKGLNAAGHNFVLTLNEPLTFDEAKKYLKDFEEGYHDEKYTLALKSFACVKETLYVCDLNFSKIYKPKYLK